MNTQKNNPTITISLVNYNGIGTIAEALRSIFSLKWPDMELLIVDQGSSDGSLDLIKKFINENNFNGAVSLTENKINTGFSGGHNESFRRSRGEFIFCCNPDLVFESDFLGKAMPFFNTEENIGALQFKLLRFDFKKSNPHIRNGKNIIDTTGLLILKNRRIVNRGQGEEDMGQYGESQEVFGADGAAPIYRKATLEDVKIPIFEEGNIKGGKFEYFDEDFLAYKEDVDLAWRMRLNGWKTLYVPDVVVYHGRGSGESAAISYIGIIKERRKISHVAKKLAFRNQRMMQIKNEQSAVFFRHFFRFLLKEILAWCYVLVFETGIFIDTAGELIQKTPKMIKKRKYIMAHKKSNINAMRKWFK